VPGFSLTLGVTLTLLSCLVLIPLSAVVIRAAGLGVGGFLEAALSERALAAYRLSFGAALVGASINGVFGLLTAWALVRYDFPFKGVVNAVVDLPFALPTAVAGIALAALYSDGGWVGRYLEPLGVEAAYSTTGVVIALTFVGLPFVVRTVEPVLRDLCRDVEEAAASLGASRWQTIARVIWPALIPAWLTGFALAFARAVGEYGSVIFISSNLPFDSEIAPLLIVIQLEQYDYAAAAAIATVMLAASFVMLLLINGVQAWSRRFEG
jgi:sulfate transport system permease protein